MKLSGGTIEWPKATSRGAKRRAGRDLRGVSPSTGMGVRGVTPGKVLKFDTQFGAIWCILQEIYVSPAFHLRERKHYHSARQCIDIVT